MKKKIFLLPSCSTCVKIAKELAVDTHNFDVIDIKSDGVSETMLDAIAKQEGGYEAVFSKRAMKYKSLSLKEQKLSEQDFKNHILNEYTFLKRPVIQIGDTYFVGNAKKTVEAAKEALTNG
jgi:arsenate reductase